MGLAPAAILAAATAAACARAESAVTLRCADINLTAKNATMMMTMVLSKVSMGKSRGGDGLGGGQQWAASQQALLDR